MAETQTPNFHWTKPDLGGDASTWGNVLNTTVDAIDSVAYANQQSGVPIGSMTMFAGPTPPANWLICDGSTLDYGATPAYQGLFNVIGRAFNPALTGTQFALPNLVQKFPIGAGANVLGAVGGALTAPIAVANLPAHAHPIIDIAHTHGINQSPHNHGDPGHSHGVSDPTHFHTGLFRQTGSPTAGATGSNLGTGSQTDAAATGISVQAALTGILANSANISIQVSGTGLSTTQNTGSGTPLPIAPPFLAINFIIRAF